jgi:hypothetical protein
MVTGSEGKWKIGSRGCRHSALVLYHDKYDNLKSFLRYNTLISIVLDTCLFVNCSSSLYEDTITKLAVTVLTNQLYDTCCHRINVILSTSLLSVVFVCNRSYCYCGH